MERMSKECDFCLTAVSDGEHCFTQGRSELEAMFQSSTMIPPLICMYSQLRFVHRISNYSNFLVGSFRGDLE